MTVPPAVSPLSAAGAPARIGVLHVVDALNIGGAEQVALSLANLLPRDRYRPFLCTTRAEGPLSPRVAPHVGRLKLRRKGRLDAASVIRFVRFLNQHDIRIVHAHASALFFCRLARAVSPPTALIWHDHYGRCDFNDRPVWLYKAATRNIAGVIAVNRTLADWCCSGLKVSTDKVWYVPNLVEDGKVASRNRERPDLPGTPGKRLVCVANFRPQKDHATLLRAMALVEAAGSGAHLLLVGDSAEPGYVAHIRGLITTLGLDHAVSYLGPRHDVASILDACDVGVLSSASEGLPLALLEYGRAGLCTVATAVGECPDVLRNGEAGVLVPPGSPGELGRALLRVIGDPELRSSLGRSFRRHVEERYSAACVMRQICQVYETVLGRAL